MKTIRSLLALASLGAACTLSAAPLGTAFTYQGHLNDAAGSANGNHDLEFRLTDAPSNSVPLSSQVHFAVAVSNGVFTVMPEFGVGAFNGDARWLEIGVRVTGSGGGFTTLLPRTPLTATPYALTAAQLSGALPASQLSGVLGGDQLAGAYGQAVTFNHAGNSISGNGSGLTALNAAQLTTGTVPDARLAANVARTDQVWSLGGNAGTSAGPQFLGTTDNQPLELKVNGLRALRIEDNGDSASDGGTVPDGAPNVIGGAPVNWVGAGVVGATIAGGGATNFAGLVFTNSVLSDFGVVGGGRNNSIAPSSWSSTMDTDGVALAAIQGLNQKLEAENAELTARLARLEQLVNAKLNGGAR